MNNQDMNHMQHLEAVAAADVAALREKEATYQGSWKRRGGVGAWMMACRKFDRLEGILSQDTPREKGGYNWDVFAAIQADPSGVDGCALAEIRDLRRYLLLVEAEMVSRGVIKMGVPQPALVETNRLQVEVPVIEDSNRHARQSYLMDGMQISDYLQEGVPFINVTGTSIGVVDRTILPLVDREHLPRVATELNHQEWKETLPEYQWMYAYEEVSRKYVLGNKWHQRWGRQWCGN